MKVHDLLATSQCNSKVASFLELVETTATGRSGLSSKGASSPATHQTMWMPPSKPTLLQRSTLCERVVNKTAVPSCRSGHCTKRRLSITSIQQSCVKQIRTPAARALPAQSTTEGTINRNELKSHKLCSAHRLRWTLKTLLPSFRLSAFFALHARFFSSFFCPFNILHVLGTFFPVSIANGTGISEAVFQNYLLVLVLRRLTDKHINEYALDGGGCG